ncbi:hypothetical protein N7456_007119 [Penicillium angulare]|uniref:Rhodopsin domain-containing protein n=1 Tax=Penicillium angulare TaxID=116970 RepID=A0A9W9FJ20_9EURO|nr:hypothetical protein N7456_007119 [Penicillium angulare]
MSSSSMSLDAYVAAGTPVIVLCAAFVAVRCFMNLKAYKWLLIDDCMPFGSSCEGKFNESSLTTTAFLLDVSFIGLAFVITAFSMNDIIIQRENHFRRTQLREYILTSFDNVSGFNNPVNHLNWLNNFAVIITVIVAFELWTTKIPILLVYIKLFGVRRWLRFVCYGTIALSGIIYVCAMSPTFIRCNTSVKSATLADLEVCTTGTTLTGVISGFVALAEDVLIFFLPIPLVRGLHLPTHKRLAVGAVFFSGILYISLSFLVITCLLFPTADDVIFSGIVASIVSLYFKYMAYQGATSDTLATMLCA